MSETDRHESIFIPEDIIVEKVYASCQQRECFPAFTVDLSPGEGPYSFVNLTLDNGLIVPGSIKIIPIPKRPNFSRVQFIIRIPYTLTVQDTEGVHTTITGNLPDIIKDIVLYYPQTRPEFELNLKIETRGELLTIPVFSKDSVRMAIGFYIVVKVTGFVELRIPAIVDVIRAYVVHRTYTTDTDFNEGIKVNLSSLVPDQLQLDNAGSTLPEQGTWTVVFDSRRRGLKWGVVGWNGTIYNDGSIQVSVSSSEDGSNFSALQNENNKGDLNLPAGRYLKMIVTLKSSSDGKSPILTDITVGSKGYQLPPTENHAPSVEAGPDAEIRLNRQLELRGEVSDDCLPDGKPLTIVWSKESGPGEVTFDDSNGPGWVKASFGQTGDYVLRLTASDSSSVSSDSMQVIVKTANLAPLVDAGPDQDIVVPYIVTLNGKVTDDGIPGTGLNIMWSKVSGPGEVVFANPAQPVTTASISGMGIYVLRLSVSDSQLSSSDDVIIRGVDVVHRTYTTDADFNEGVKVNLSNKVPDQLQIG